MVVYDWVVRAISTVVAHFLHTEGVTGSNPVSPMFALELLRLLRDDNLSTRLYRPTFRVF